MAQLLRRNSTYADLEALPAHLTGELIAGELLVHPRPAPRHSNALASLGDLVRGPFQRGRGGPGGWWILPEPEVHLEADVLVPDLGGFRRSRLPTLAATAYLALAPDWVGEVLSPSTEAYDRGLKMGTYARHRVPHVWLLDGLEQTLETYQNDAGVMRPAGRWQGAGRARIAPFDEVELDLGELWAE